MTRVHFAVQRRLPPCAGAVWYRRSPAHAVAVLAPHRAVYDLTLTRTRGKRPIKSVRGRILYDFNGSPCEGYALQFRQVSEIDRRGQDGAE